MGALDDFDAQTGPLWPALEALALPAREKRRLPPDTRSRIILELCALAPLSVKELSLLLARSEAYIGDAIRPLVTAGDLTFSYPDQPRHPKQRYRSSNPFPVRAPEPEPEPVRAPEPVRRPEPIRAPVQVPARAAPAAPAPAPSPSPEHEPVPVSIFPNRITNVVFVLATGILLAALGTEAWPLFIGLAAFALALAHIVADSSQYEQFRMLHGPRSNGPIPFVLLKAGVAAIEIIIIYFVTSAVVG